MKQKSNRKSLWYRLKEYFSYRRKKDKKDTIPEDVSILSCNCVGGMIYHDYHRRFLSPTINLYMNSRDFAKFILNLDEYLSYDFIEYKNKEHPIGLLGDITVHFLHYASFTEAVKKWNERKKRIIKDRIFVIMTEDVMFDDSVLDDFRKIPYPKILFAHKDYHEDDIIFMKKYRHMKHVGDITEFYDFNGNRVYEHYFDFPSWLNGRKKVKDCHKTE